MGNHTAAVASALAGQLERLAFIVDIEADLELNELRRREVQARVPIADELLRALNHLTGHVRHPPRATERLTEAADAALTAATSGTPAVSHDLARMIRIAAETQALARQLRDEGPHDTDLPSRSGPPPGL